jgi:isoleucyl-tRNA synthetase
MDEQGSNKSAHAKREEEILAFWKEKDIFEKSLNKEAPKGEYTFFDGPPFATGTPHYGHILAGTMKDVIPRYKTMQGYKVKRRWGWDCHGLPVENLVEKELGLKSKKDIVDYSIGRFNEAARKSVMRYADEWRKVVPRLGRWVDMDHDYRTMDATYTETVWWIFKQLYNKDLIYKGFKSMNLCPHCETTLSNFEVAQGYKDIIDISVTVKFQVRKYASTQGESQDVFLLAWTTTPWTLPGNVALAVNPEVEYVKVKIEDSFYILAKSRLNILKDKKYEIAETIKGVKLIDLEYEPLFDYYSKDSKLKNRENGWKIYGANFVTTVDGTGIVHIAPAFGSDDYDLLLKYNLPFIQHVAVDGTFKKEVTDFAGMKVKPIDTDEDKSSHQKADIEILKWLVNKGQLFEKEKIVHSYPHCWRCYTPLLNYAASSWFVKVTSFKDKLVKVNEKIDWIPEEVGKYRFGNWLSEARDWAISRTRFWGAPIPVWEEKNKNDCDKYFVFGSVDDLKKYSKSKNTYYVMRHGEAENNTLEVLSGIPSVPHHLTKHGNEQVIRTAQSLKGIKFDAVFVSPFVRTLDTANILMNTLGLSNDIIHIDDRIRELGTGDWNGRKIGDFINEFKHDERFDRGPEGGENYTEIKKRMGDFLYDLESKYEDKTILVITHETPLFLLVAAARGLNRKEALCLRGEKDFIDNAGILKLDFCPIPHNAEYELDLHRPFIDDIGLKTPEGNDLIRVSDVFDCWFESGSMPYGEAHYPFDNKDFEPKSLIFGKSKGFPADFIAEGLDQTRGWFYSMLVLGVALFGKTPYKKVLVNGLVLAEDGQKMSKSKKNFPDPMQIVDKYGADSLRFYLMSSPVVRAQDLCFSEKGVDEVTKKVVNRLLNVVAFYEMYANGIKTEILESKPKSSNILDSWIICRLNEIVASVTNGLEVGELDRASRPIIDFIDDLSTWYLRRSRDRFKKEGKDKEDALFTTRYLLLNLAKIMAPFVPFLAEYVYQNVRGVKESVHLEEWPNNKAVDSKLLDDMKIVRAISREGLEARMSAKINVRQPLKELKSKNANLKNLNIQFVELIRDEVNVKEVAFDGSIEKNVELDFNITPKLKEEGELRELIRKIQDLRKEKSLVIGDTAMLIVNNELKELVSKNEEVIKKVTNLKNIEFGDRFELKV